MSAVSDDSQPLSKLAFPETLPEETPLETTQVAGDFKGGSAAEGSMVCGAQPGAQPEGLLGSEGSEAQEKTQDQAVSAGDLDLPMPTERELFGELSDAGEVNEEEWVREVLDDANCIEEKNDATDGVALPSPTKGKGGGDGLGEDGVAEVPCGAWGRTKGAKLGDGKITEEETVALENYARAKNLVAADVLLKDVAESEEGILYWCCLGVDFSANSAMDKKFKRSLAHNLQASNVYANLLDEPKRKFREMWKLHRNFDWIAEERIERTVRKDSTIKAGEYMNVVQIANALGGFQYKICRTWAANYVRQCKVMGGKFGSYNLFCKSSNFLFIRHACK